MNTKENVLKKKDYIFQALKFGESLLKKYNIFFIV